MIFRALFENSFAIISNDKFCFSRTMNFYNAKKAAFNSNLNKSKFTKTNLKTEN